MADVRTSELVINKLTKQQYENIQNPSPTELYLVPEDEELDPHRVIEFQVPTAENNYTWYRKYADGWVEQGTILSNLSATVKYFTFPITMKDSNYIVNGLQYVNNSTIPSTNHIVYIRSKSQNSVGLKIGNSTSVYNISSSVEVKGMYATE